MVLLALACIAAAELGYRLTVTVGATAYPIIWAPLGILTAALLCSGRDRWPSRTAIAAAVLLASGILLHGHAWRADLLTTGVTVITAWAIASLVRLRLDQPFTIVRVDHVWTFVVASIAVPLASAAAQALVQTGWSGADLALAWRANAAGSVLALMLVVPFSVGMAAGQTSFSSTASWRQRLEPLAAIAVGIVLTILVFGDFVPVEMRAPAYVMPVLLWAAFRTAAGDTAATLLIICLIAIWETAAGRGPFTLITPGAGASSWVLRVQGVGVACTISIVLLAAVVAERKRAAAERDQLVGELQQALAEIKTIQGLIPLCAWCHKIRNDGGSWQGLESYLQQHTDATFSHGICPSCSRRVEVEHLTAVSGNETQADERKVF